MNIIGIRNRRVRQLPPSRRKRRWYAVGARVSLGPGRLLEIASEQRASIGALLLIFHGPAGAHAVREPEDLSWFTTEVLVRAVSYRAGGVDSVLLDIGELVTAPALHDDIAQRS